MHAYRVVTPGTGVPNSEAGGLTVIGFPEGWIVDLIGTEAPVRGSAVSGTAGAVGLRPAGAGYEGPPTLPV